MGEYDAFAPVYEEWVGPLVGRHPVLRRARAGDRGAARRARGGQRRASRSRSRGRRGAACSGSTRRRRCSSWRASAARRPASTSSCGSATCASSTLDEPAGLVYCPFRSLNHLPTWADRRAVFERVAAALRPGRPVRLERVRLRPARRRPRPRARAAARGRPDLGVRRALPRRQPDRGHDVRRRARAGAAHGELLVGDALGVGRPDRDRPGSRSRRCTAGSTAGRSTSRAASSSGSPASPAMSSPYDAIAELYDPWSRSVTEDVAFYVEEAVRAGGPVVELGVGTAGSRCRSRPRGSRVIGVDSSAGMLERCRERGAAGRASRSCSTCGSATSASRRSTERVRARHLAVPRVPPPRRRRRAAAGAARRAGAARARRAARVRRVPAEPRGHRRHARPLARARARDLGARAVGRSTTQRLVLSVKGVDGSATMALAWLEPNDWERLLERGRLPVVAPLRLVRPAALPRRRGHRLDRGAGLT